MIFNSIPGLVVGLFACAVGLILILRLRGECSRAVLLLMALGLFLLSLALGGPTMSWRQKQKVLVMIDRSPSTRGAAYWDTGLSQRIKALVGLPAAYHIVPFGDGATETRFEPPSDAAAIVLFSDGRFELPPSAPPTYVVVDPNLEHVEDARVARLHQVDDVATAEISNDGAARGLLWTGAHRGPTTSTTIPAGGAIVSATISKDTPLVSAHLEPGDRWPENDALALRVPPPAQAERWWIADSPAGEGWRSLTPSQLPGDASAYLKSAIIVLSNTPADAIPVQQQRRLSQYVRDLGGTLVILGGDRAFGGGGYARTTLDNLSPLASTPPAPTTHWMLLIDSSGSMSATIAGGTRFLTAVDSVHDLLLHLPPADLASVGGFARELTWWITRQPIGELRKRLVPAEVSPNGPTNLQAALEAIARSADRSLPNELLIVSDTDAAISDPGALAQSLAHARVRVSVLGIGESQPNAALAQIATSTSGRLIHQRDAARWPEAMRELARAAEPGYLIPQQTKVAFSGPLSFLGACVLPSLNRTWLKKEATDAGSATTATETLAMAALWQLGGGRVIAIAAPMPASDAAAIADRFARPPTDPRFKVTWDDDANVTVRIEAQKPGGYLNGLSPMLTLLSGAGEHHLTRPIPQTGPGQYALSIAPPTLPMLATVTVEGTVVARTSLAGHYPREFSATGNDHRAMDELAKMTGGRVIEPGDSGPIDFHWPTRSYSLSPWLAAMGAVLVGVALLRWRRLS